MGLISQVWSLCSASSFPIAWSYEADTATAPHTDCLVGCHGRLLLMLLRLVLGFCYVSGGAIVDMVSEAMSISVRRACFALRGLLFAPVRALPVDKWHPQAS